MNVLAVLWWVLALGGLIPTTVFLWRFRPRWPIRQPSLIINGFALLAWLSYLRSVLVVASRGWVPEFPDVVSTSISLGVGALADGLLILLLISFLRYRKRWQAERNENGREDQR